ncbi:MAG: hypothetical protein ACXVJ7_12775 [Acidimicrobiia bacterium]
MDDPAATLWLITAPLSEPVRPAPPGLPDRTIVFPRRPPATGRRVATAVTALAALFAGALWAGTAGAHAPSPRTRTLTVVAEDFRLTVPATVAAGRTRIRLVNHGAEGHQAALVRLHPGHDSGEFFGALATDGFGASARFGRFVGGPNAAVPNGTSEVVVDLRAGRYLAVCLMPGADGVPHVMKGMTTPFEVTGTSPRSARPHRVPEVTLDEFRFGVPKQFVRAVRAGDPIDVVNHGRQHHELVISELPQGVDVSEVAHWSDQPTGTPRVGPQPQTDVAGVTMLPPGGRARLRTKLPRGRYALLCFLPDDHSSASHLHNGMVYPFTVR